MGDFSDGARNGMSQNGHLDPRWKAGRKLAGAGESKQVSARPSHEPSNALAVINGGTYLCETRQEMMTELSDHSAHQRSSRMKLFAECG